jgi:hypothetical protein
MLRRILHAHVLSRLMVGLFVVQFFAAGFCLMMPQAHATPMVKVAHSMPDTMDKTEHCTQPMETQMSHDTGYFSCMHCEHPDSFLQNVSAPVQLDLAMLPDLLAVPKASDWISRGISLYSQTPSGLTRSSSLIYSTTLRIRI